jgi:hypothetical protein
MDDFPRIYREKGYPACGRLIVLDDGTQADHLQPLDQNKFFSIDFPAMPDQIELARQADYRVQTNYAMPDGVHLYRGTNPMEVPFEFKLHYLDKSYCKEGALTLINIAARLHALVLPMGNSTLRITVQNDSPLDHNGQTDQGAKKPGTETAQSARAGQNSADNSGINQQADADSSATVTLDSSNAIDPPVTCRLELMYSTSTGPGVVCNGYVKNVKVAFLKPWLRGPNGSFNLPSGGIYSFTFIHHPGHGNYFSNRTGVAAISQQANAYADFMRSRFYNTRMLQTTSKYRGFSRTTR